MKGIYGVAGGIGGRSRGELDWMGVVGEMRKLRKGEGRMACRRRVEEMGMRRMGGKIRQMVIALGGERRRKKERGGGRSLSRGCWNWKKRGEIGRAGVLVLGIAKIERGEGRGRGPKVIVLPNWQPPDAGKRKGLVDEV